MRHKLAALVVIAMLAAVAIPVLDAGAATRAVTVGDDFFSPRSMTVNRGDTLRFVWRRTRHPHNVSANGRASRTTKRSGFVYRRRVTRSTTFICTVHPVKMRLRVSVRR